MLQTETKKFNVICDNSKITYTLNRLAVGPLLINHKQIWLYQFKINDRWEIYNVLLYSSEFNETLLMPIFKNKEIILRIDSGCLTGQLYNDETCDCKQQLQEIIRELTKNKEGLIIHIPSQDG